MITPVCFSPICEMSCIFLLQLNMTKRRHIFLGNPETSSLDSSSSSSSSSSWTSSWTSS